MANKVSESEIYWKIQDCGLRIGKGSMTGRSRKYRIFRQGPHWSVWADYHEGRHIFEGGLRELASFAEGYRLGVDFSSQR